MFKQNDIVRITVPMPSEMKAWLIEDGKRNGYENISPFIRYIINQWRNGNMETVKTSEGVTQQEINKGKHVWLLFIPVALFLAGALARGNPLLINWGIAWFTPLAYYLGFLSLGAITLFIIIQMKR